MNSETLSATYHSWVAALRPEDRPSALAVQAALGVSFEEAVWDKLIRPEPNRSLPALIGPDCSTRPPGEIVEIFLHAHRLAGFYGLVVERLYAQEGSETPATRELLRLLRQGWVDTLADATGSEALAQDTITRAIRRWRLGAGLEKWYLTHGQLEPSYARISRLKNGWMSASSVAMLTVYGGAGQASALARAYDCFLLGMQCRRDVEQADLDRERRGTSIPDAMGVAPGVLLRAAPFLIHRAAAHARRGELHTLAAWFDELGEHVLAPGACSEAVGDGLQAMIVTARMDQAMAAMEDAAGN